MASFDKYPQNHGQQSGSGGGLTPQQDALLNGAEQRSNKNNPGGYPGLDSGGQIDPNAVPNSIAEQVTAVFDTNDLTHAPNSAAVAGELALKANSADVPDMTAIADGDVPLYDAATGTFKPSGVRLISDGVGVKSLLMPDNTEIESQSLSVGDVVRIGEAGSFVCFRNQVDGKQYFALDVLVDKVNGTYTPHYMQVGAENSIIVQPQFGTILTGASLSSTFTTTQMQLISGVRFKVASNMTNVRMQVVDVASGKVLKSWPSKADWMANTGASWAAGDVDIDLSTNQVQFPSAGIQVRLDLKADAISVRGSSTQPYLEIKTQNGAFVNLASQPWAQAQISAAITATLALTYDPLDTTHALTPSAAESRILSAISQAQATRRQVGTWNASTNTPTLTNPPTTISGTTLQIGDYVEVTTAGTQFGITWAVGDIAKVVQTTGGALGWYKDPVQNDKFDSKNVWASQAAGSDANSGSLYRPKQTLSGAIGVVAQPGSIHLTPGVYAAGALTISKTNVNIFGEGVNANNSVEISGQITTAAGRIRLRNVNFTQGSGSAFTWNDSTGGHHIQDIGSTTGQTGPIFTGSANAGGVLSTISNGDLSGSVAANNIVLANRASGTAGLYLVNLANVRISVGTGWIVYVNACPDIQITGNTAGVYWVDVLNVNAILTQQSQLTALQADTNVATDGFYICDFASPSVGARNDLLLKKSIQGIATNVQVNRPYAQCPATVSVFNGSSFDEYGKKAGGWYADSSGSGSGIASVTMAQRAAITTAGTYYNSTTKVVESYDGTNWKPLSPINIAEFNPASVVNSGIYIIQSGGLPPVVQNGVINQGDIFLFDGSLYWLLYTWKNSPSAVAIDSNTQNQTLLKANSPNGWYYAPVPASRDTGILYAKQVTSANGTPLAPYQMIGSDFYVEIDDPVAAVGVMLPLAATVAATTMTRKFTISRRRSVSQQTVVIKTSSAGSDLIVGGIYGQPSGENQIYLQPGESITLHPVIDPTMGNIWQVENADGYFGSMRFDTEIFSSITLTTWGRYYRASANSADVSITLPFSTFGKAGSHLKIIRTDTNSTKKLTILAPSGYTINGNASMEMPVGSSAMFSIHTGNTTQIVGELTIGNTVTPQFCWLAKSSQSVSAGVTTTISFNGSDTGYTSSDYAGMHSGTTNTSRITIKQTGEYRVSAKAQFSGWIGADAKIAILKNGGYLTEKWQGKDGLQLSWIAPNIETSQVVRLASGDYVEMQVFNSGSGTYTVVPQLTVESLNFQGLINPLQQTVVGATMARKQATSQIHPSASELIINYDMSDTSRELLASSVGVTYNNGRVTNTSGSTIVISVYTQNIFTGSGAGVRWCWLKLSDATRIGQTRGDGDASQDTTVNVVVPNLVMAPGEYFDFAAWHNAGVNLTVNGSGSGLGAPNSGRMLISRIR